MSANNWTTCPRCEATELERVKQLKLKAEKAYGKVTSDEYLSLLDEANKPAKFESTFREDYQIGVHKGKLTFEYRGGCTVCGLSKEFNHEQAIE